MARRESVGERTSQQPLLKATEDCQFSLSTTAQAVLLTGVCPAGEWKRRSRYTSREEKTESECAEDRRKRKPEGEYSSQGSATRGDRG